MKLFLIISALGLAVNGRLLGGFHEVPVEEDISDLMNFLSKTINEGLHPASHFVHIERTQVHKQIVSGANYEVTMNLFKTPCFIYQLGETMPNVEDCPKGSQMTDEPCTIKVWDQPWMGEKRFKILQNHCVTTVANEKPMLSDLMTDDAFATFETTYGKQYAHENERAQRKEIFQRNMATAFKLQSMEMGTGVYGPSIFADMTGIF